MLKKKGFDSKLYLASQKAEIFKRLNKFDRLYLEFGGHLFYDGHASRVLPGYDPRNKIKLLKQLGEFDLIYCVNAKDLDSKKRLGDFNLTYEKQVLKNLKDIKKAGFKVSYVVITRYEGEKRALDFKRKLAKKKIRTFFHFEIKGYSESFENALNGYKKQHYLHVKKNLVVVTGAAGGSGKMATALTQIYHERKDKIKSGFSKFETFPIWNLPLVHPINVAYEAATADLQDRNMFDPFHRKAYGERAVNYNRDIKNFEILEKIAKKITGQKTAFGFRSPTDMGVNMAKEGIIDEDVCRKAAKKEILRRWKVYNKEFKKGRESVKTIERMKVIMKKVGLKF